MTPSWSRKIWMRLSQRVACVLEFAAVRKHEAAGPAGGVRNNTCSSAAGAPSGWPANVERVRPGALWPRSPRAHPEEVTRGELFRRAETCRAPDDPTLPLVPDAATR